MSRTIIAGCGAAGATAACALKDMLPGEDVVLIDQTDSGLYSRIRIPEVLAGKLPEEKLGLISPLQLTEKGVEFLSGTKILSVDTVKKTVEYEGGSISYDRFVFALGSSPAIPPIPGASREMGFRDLEDLHRFEEILKTAENALVIGGGLLGLEIADAVLENGVKVTVSEIADRLLPSILNEKESSYLFDYLSNRGFRIICSGKVSGISGNGTGYSVNLNGTEETFDLVLISAGICPEIRIAENAGIKVGKGICINDRFETSAKDVYAIGDCAELNGKVDGLWMSSKAQGTALASILAGKTDRYEPKVFSPVPKLPGITLKALKETAASK